ncbi:spore coat F-containing protein [Desulfocucumis palustris]|uniref:Spore coat F-containing protein n=1 Tax=Desulfocucumis palustris TaxID=1898651 RepID=A0A2L2X835_9FIRM|nr:spore coat protein [Desulfocucumis palustris]GBF32325.1 spore coat F-containing protein [Desulfocucumis palustris]
MMQQNQIKNPQSPLLSKTKGPEMNDRDMVNETLAGLKYITDNFNVFAREASHQALHNDVMGVLVESHGQTREVFNLMFRKGWYTLEPENSQKLQQTHQQFVNYQSQFPYNPGMLQ